MVDRVQLLANLNELLRHAAEPDAKISQQAVETCVHTLTALLWGLGYDRLLVHQTLLARGFAGVAEIAGPRVAAAVLDELAKGLRQGD